MFTKNFLRLVICICIRFFDDATWVSQRWLEVLPLECHHFEHLVTQQDCSATLSFLGEAFRDDELENETRH